MEPRRGGGRGALQVRGVKSGRGLQHQVGGLFLADAAERDDRGLAVGLDGINGETGAVRVRHQEEGVALFAFARAGADGEGAEGAGVQALRLPIAQQSGEDLGLVAGRGMERAVTFQRVKHGRLPV